MDEILGFLFFGVCIFISVKVWMMIASKVKITRAVLNCYKIVINEIRRMKNGC